MKTSTIVVLVGGLGLLGVVYLMTKKTTAAVSAKTAIPTASLAGGVTIDSAGNYWSGGAMIWKAPTQSWTT